MASGRGMRPVRIANFSGHSADRITGLAEVLEWGSQAPDGFLGADFAVGDFLAEATLAYLAKRDVAGTGGGGFLPGFAKQLRACLRTLVEKGVKVVTNAGGANPAALAKAVESMAVEVLGNDAGKVKVAWVEGDNVSKDLAAWTASGEVGELRHMDTDQRLADWDKEPMSANAYLGGFGIVEALERGANIVVCGRITDATLTLAPAAWWWKWSRTDFDKLASSILVGHVIECGAHVTGGNFSGFLTIPRNINTAFPIAVVDRDGSAIVTKAHPHGGGDVTLDTVTAQTVYEIQGPLYKNPDATVDLPSAKLEEVEYEWPRRGGSGSEPAPRTKAVRISGVRGLPPPPTTKVGVNAPAGFACEVSVFAVGLDIPGKFLHFQMQVRELLHRNGNSVEHLFGNPSAGNAGKNRIEAMRFECVGYNGPLVSSGEDYLADPLTQNACTAWFRVTASSRTREPVSRPRFAGVITGQGILQGFPGFVCQADGSKFDPAPFIEFFPTTIPQSAVKHTAHLPGLPAIPVPPPPVMAPVPAFVSQDPTYAPRSFGPTRRVPLGLVAHGRCGDKGGNANLGFWPIARASPGKEDEAWEWLRRELTTERCRELLGNEIAEVERQGGKVAIVRWEMANMRAVCFVVKGLLGKGLSSNMRVDPLGKSVAEFVRARLADVPAKFLDEVAAQRAKGVYGVGVGERTIGDVDRAMREVVEQVRVARL
ncbi:hypothetical protein DFJ74DRAFT_770486 [Hyaloraphidium curvatum]|nr:hypothetical protein DFJ74DRAFT_770486 [Hyaloraphidium curvatum]